MGTSKKKKPAQPSSDHKKWELIFNALKQMLRKQAVQLDSLLEERKFLQERIQIQYERWNSDVRLLEDVLFQVFFTISEISSFTSKFRVLDCFIDFVDCLCVFLDAKTTIVV